MAEAGWGHGRPVETDTGIASVLHAFVTQGGQILGARRWPDNPLTLTHVRWQGPNSGPLEAIRRPNDGEDMLPPGEREVWVQLALAFPATYTGPSGVEAPWAPLAVDREKAFGWLQILRQEHHRSSSPSGWPAHGSAAAPRGWPADGGYEQHRGPAFGSVPGGGSTGPYPSPNKVSGRPMSPAYGAHQSVPSGPMSAMSGFPTVVEQAVPPTSQRQTPPYGAQPRPASSYTVDEQPAQRTGSWQRGGLGASEVAVIPCVEVELPPMLGGLASDDYRRDFARDVAMHFSRAARAVPQVHDVRGWMRGDRLVLAARFVVAMGNRPPTQAEMNGVAQILADALAQRTLPYAQLGFADPGEWTQGAPLPE